MNINLTTGSTSFRLTSGHLTAWLADMVDGITAAGWKPSTPATHTLKHQWETAMTHLLKIRNDATSQTFVGDLQTIVNSCS